MAELFKKFLGASSEAPLNGFDLSSREVYSTKVGLLNAVKSVFTIPRGEYSIDVKSLVRSAQPLQTTAFTRFDMQYEFYRVHINDLYSSFNQLIAMREDEQVSLHPDFTAGFPYFDYLPFAQAVAYVAIYDYLVDHPFNFTKDGHNVTAYALTAKDDDDETSRRRNAYFFVSENQPFESLALSVVRSLDMYGYGNILPMVKLGYKLLVQWYTSLNDLHPTQDTFIRISFTDVLNKLADSTHSPDSSSYTYKDYYDACWSGVPDTLKLNLWLPLAYNKIFSEEYRNPYYDFIYHVIDNYNEVVSSYSYEYVKLFNLDDKTSFEIELDGTQYSGDFVRLLAIFALKYRPYGKDMFNGVLPSTQFGDISVMTTDNEYYEIIAQTKNSSNVSVQVSSATGKLYNSTPGGVNAKYSFNPAIAISVLEQRRADALQKFNENRLRAGNRTSSNFIAHFGVAPKSEPHHSVSFLGSFDGSIELNQVASTNTSENNQLGQLVSNGVGVVQGNKIHYKTDDFDIIMCIQSISKPSEYDSYGINRELQILDVWDYPYSELQNISLKPLDRITYNVFNGSTPRVLGYLPAFIEKKTDVDRVHGEFYSGLPYSTLDNRFNNIPNGLFSSYVTPRDNTYAPNTIGFLYISPDSVDNVFEAMANSSQETDQFICNCLFDIKAVQPLSVLGLPK